MAAQSLSAQQIPGDQMADDDPSSGDSPLPVRRRKKKARTGKPKKPRRAGAMSGLWGTLKDLSPFLLGRVLPVCVLIGVCVWGVLSITQGQKAAKQKEQLAGTLWDTVRGASTDHDASPYVRGKLAILETQSMVEFDLQEPSRPQHWINDYIEPPLNKPGEIGSVILVEWNIVPKTTTVKLEMTGQTKEVELKAWNCRVKLIDVKRRTVVYSSALLTNANPLHVTEGELTAEFDKIKNLPQIGLDDEPPPESGS